MCALENAEDSLQVDGLSVVPDGLSSHCKWRMMLRPSGCWATSHDAPGTSPSLPSFYFPYVFKCYYYMCVFTDIDVKMCYKNEMKLNYTTKLLLTARESAGHYTS